MMKTWRTKLSSIFSSNGEKKPKPLKIHVGPTGSVEVDAKEFFAQPKVRRQIEALSKVDIVGRKLDFKMRPPHKKSMIDILTGR